MKVSVRPVRLCVFLSPSLSVALSSCLLRGGHGSFTVERVSASYQWCRNPCSRCLVLKREYSSRHVRQEFALCVLCLLCRRPFAASTWFLARHQRCGVECVCVC